MFKALSRTGHRDSTTLIFATDHGDMLGDRDPYSEGL